MARKQIVNGKVYDWSSVTIGMSGCGGIEPKEISYDDEKEKTLIYGKGGRIRGYGTGQAKNAVKISMLREDFNIFMDAVKASYKKNKFYWLLSTSDGPPVLLASDSSCHSLHQWHLL